MKQSVHALVDLREQTPVVVRVTIAAAIFTAAHGLTFELSDHPVRVAFAVAAAYAANLAVYAWRRGPVLLAAGTALITLFGSLTIQYVAGGLVASGFNAIWAMGAALMGAVLFGGRYSRPGLALFAAVVVGELLFELKYPPAVPQFAPWLVPVTAIVNVVMLGAIATESLALFIRQRDNARAALATENARSQQLLERILPVQVVRRLKAKTGTIADRLDATILFADVVGFTPLARTQTPEQSVELLDELFSAFDAVVERYGLEKIKTIGDAYMAAGGVPEPSGDHAEAVAGLALELQSVVESFRTQQGVALRVRIGIHTGPVIAGVIGTKRFAYDLWGDTVNVASRMESHGEPDEVQVTEAVYDKLKDRFDFEPRGSVDVKGIGAMKTWRLRGRRVTP